MTILHWVRHGPTHAKTMIGWTDRPADLSDRARVARLAAYLPNSALVVSSDLSRAAATADAIGQPSQTRLPHDPTLRELHFGAWEDRSFDDVSAAEPETIAAFWQEPGQNRATGGESWDELADRVSEAANRLIPLGKEIIVVAHFGAILTQLQRARLVPTTEIFGQTIEPLSVTSLRWHGDRWEELCANHCP